MVTQVKGAVVFNRTFEDYGAVGDGVADDTLAVLAGLADNVGRTAYGVEGSVYRVTQQLTLQDYSKLALNGAKLLFDIDGEERCLVLKSNTVVSGGIIENQGTEPVGGWGAGTGEFQSPILVGDYETGAGDNNILIYDMEIISNRTDGNGISILGDCYDIRVSNITYPDSTVLGRPILCHWGGYNGGSPVTTTHPHKITFENISCGAMTKKGQNQALVFISACYDITVKNVDATETEVAVWLFAGDYGNSLSANRARWVGSNITVDGVSCEKCTNYGIRVTGNPFISGSNIITQSLIRNVIVNGGPDVGTDGLAGILCENSAGVTVERCRFSVFDYGVDISEGAVRTTIKDTEVSNIRISGVFVNDATTPPQDTYLYRVHSYDVNTNLSTTGTNRACIYVGDSVNTQVVSCTLGLFSGENGNAGVRVTGGAVNPVLVNNYVFGLIDDAGVFCYSLASPDVIGANNDGDPSETLFGTFSVKTRVGRGYLWVDDTGDVRVSSTAPASETDGVVVGTQT